MEEKLTKLRNTLFMIETKGENTKTMALCLNYLDQLIAEEQNKAKQQPVEVG